MDTDKYNRTITLQCPTCGGTQFDGGDDESPQAILECASCGLKISRDDLRAGNKENISAHVDEIKKAVVEDVTKSIRDAFKGNKHFRIK